MGCRLIGMEYTGKLNVENLSLSLAALYFIYLLIIFFVPKHEFLNFMFAINRRPTSGWGISIFIHTKQSKMFSVYIWIASTFQSSTANSHTISGDSVASQ